MATQVNYSTNPKTYQNLIAAGVSQAQITEAINSGLNPSQLPPEYFGMTSGWTPSPVSTQSYQSNQIGGIDIPPASMGDPYASSAYGTPNDPGSMNTGGSDISSFGLGNTGMYGGLPSSAGIGGQPTVQIFTDPFAGIQGGGSYGTPLGSFGGYGTVPNFGFPTDFNLESSPSATNSYLGVPGYYSPGLQTDPSGAGMAGSGSLPYTDPTPIPYDDTYSMGTSGSDIAGFGGSMDITGGQTLGYVPQPGYNYYDAGNGTQYVYDSDWNYLYTSNSPFSGVTGSGTMGTAVNADGTATPQSPAVPASGPMSPYDPSYPYGGAAAPGTGSTGGFGVGAGAAYGVTPAGFSTGYTPFGGGGSLYGSMGTVGPQFSPGGLGGGVGGIGGGGAFTTSYMHGGVDPTSFGNSAPGGIGLEGLHGAMSGMR